MNTLFVDIIGFDLPEGFVAPNGLNGGGGILDMATVASYVHEKFKFVSNAGAYDLTSTIAYALWVAQSKPLNAVPVTAEVVALAKFSIEAALYRYSILDLFAHSDAGNIALRVNDSVIGAWGGANTEALIEVATRICH
jgi:hypothetical protein